MKKLILTLALGASLFADSLSVTGLAISKHTETIDVGKRAYNSDHRYIGLKYDFYEKDSLTLGVEFANFKNSFEKNTKTLVASAELLPFTIGNVRFGGAIGLGYQDGYCMDGFKMKECEDGDSNNSLIVLPSFMAKWDNALFGRDVFVNVAMFSTETFVTRFGVEVLKW